jgi:hypothetical protein
VSKLFRYQDDRIAFKCPGCKAEHVLNSSWAFNGTDDVPTFAPSVLVTRSWQTTPYRCHLFIRSGQLEFLTDCTHELAGKTVPMEDYPDVGGT